MEKDQELTHGGRFNIMTGDNLRVLQGLISTASDESAKRYLLGVQDGIRLASDIFFKSRDETRKLRPGD